MSARSSFDSAAEMAFEPDAKIGLLATLDPQGAPHITLISTLRARAPCDLAWGQFCEGASKRHVQRDPRVGFLVMTMDRESWRGRARWTHLERRGEVLDAYNQRPMFRYNAYFGIHTVHHMRLERLEGPAPLSLPPLAIGSALSAAVSPFARGTGSEGALSAWTRGHLRALQTLKFLSWIDADGYPTIAAAVPAMPAGTGRVVVAAAGNRSRLLDLPPGGQVALFALNLQMESVLLGGTLSAFRGPPGAELAALQVERVYNSMPPKQGPVWPPPPLEPITSFE